MNHPNTVMYTERAALFRAAAKKNKRNISLLSFARLLLFGAFVWFLVIAFQSKFQGSSIGYALTCMTAFLVCVGWAGALQKKNRFLQQLVLINENENNVSAGELSFLDNGHTFIPASGFAVDLPVFGSRSLFHLLNRTASLTGRQQLAARLKEPFVDRSAIETCQACVKELSGKTAFRQTLLANTLLLEEEKTLNQLQDGFPENEFASLQNRFWTLLATCWPVAAIVLIVLSAWKGDYRWLLASMLAGLLVLSFILKKVNLLYFHISKRSYLYDQYARCFLLVSAEKFQHPWLVQKQAEIIHAAAAFRKLSRLTGLFDLRLSMLSLFINGLFLLDLVCARAYLRWNRQYQKDIKTWFDTLGEIELLNSLGTFHNNHPDLCFPGCIDTSPLIEATAMGHPLMKASAAIVNDMAIGNPAKLYLITGSNMSGKSTFLRTVGLNMILAQCGAPVFAKTFRFTPMRLLTSFHHIDSLEESTSYFYAELKCLQGIIASLAQSPPGLVLLDEVMRGTNSKDKHDGTALLIQKLLNHSCLTLIATHDTELGELAAEHPGQIANVCFESELTDDGLHFDFRIRQGVAQTKNATYLMQKMGII